MAKCIHLNGMYDSITEACVAAWLNEAWNDGWIKDYDEQAVYPLTDKVTYRETKQLKTKTKEVEKTLLQPAEYTADFVAYVLAPQVRAAFEEAGLRSAGVSGAYNEYVSSDGCVFVIDVKGERCPAAQAAKFSLTQKMLHHVSGVYVNKLVPCARKPKAKARSFFMLCGLPNNLPEDCYLKDGSGYRQPWRDMFAGCPTIAEALDV